MKLPCLFQPRILEQALSALFSKPYTTAFPAEPYQPIPQFRGRPRFHEPDCIGCGACAEVCPPKCIDVVDETRGDDPKRTLVQHLDQCIWCGQCERYCTTKTGIKLGNEWECVGFRREDFEEKVEKPLVLCEVCGRVIAPLDQLLWIARRLGPLAFTNPTLMLATGRALAVVDPPLKTESEGVLRGDRLTLHCPHCRRKTSFVA